MDAASHGPARKSCLPERARWRTLQFSYSSPLRILPVADRTIPPHLIAKERQLLAAALQAALGPAPRKRRMSLRKVSQFVERTWVSAGCFGEAVQWKLKPRKRAEG